MKVASLPWKSALFLVCLSGTRPALAMQSLDSFLERAKTQSFDAREATATEEQRSAEAGSALGRLTPAFSARGAYTRNQEEVGVQLPGSTQRLVITPLNQLDAYLQLDVPLVDLASYHRYKAASAVAASAREQRGATTIDVSRSVARAYYLLQGASALVTSARESLKAAQANLDNVDDRRSAGAATELDHARAAANVSRAEQELADSELGVALAARSLETLSGLAATDPEPLPEDDLRSEGQLTSWLSLASQTPQQRVAQKLGEAAEQNRKAANRVLWPTLAGSAQERISNASGFGGKNANYTLQLVLSWRLDYSAVANSDAQQAALDVQRVRVERTLRAGEDAAFEAFKRVEAGLARSRAARAQAAATTRAAELSLDRYSAGVATQLDVTQDQRDAFLAVASKIQADAELAYSRAALRLATGVPLSDKRPR